MTQKHNRTTTRREFLHETPIGLSAPSLLHAAPSKRPNILFVFADQLRKQELGCYGNQAIHTPNIDRLAREGVRFTNAISTFPLCSPFRAMLLTGKYPMANGMTVNDHVLNPDAPSFGQILRDAGYRTGYIGKWHIDGHGRTSFTPRERRRGFDFWMALECTHEYFKSQYYEGDSDQPRFWQGYDAIAQTRAAETFIRDHARNGPFALFLSWGPPHNPYVAPPEYMQRFAPARMSLRANVADRKTDQWLMENRRTRIPKSFENTRRDWRQRSGDEKVLREWYAGYYAATTCLDDLIGDLRRRLAEEGVLDNTIFVFASDHGDMLGSHGLVEKTVPFEEAISIPLIISFPGRVPAGGSSDALAGPIDFMPTVLSLAGVRCPRVDGMDLSSHALKKGGHERDAILLMAMTPPAVCWIVNSVEPWRGVRTKTHTYARFADGRPWLLYDNIEDPLQMCNLVETANGAAVKKDLEKRLTALLKRANDPCDTRQIDEAILAKNPGGLGHEFIRLAREVNPGML